MKIKIKGDFITNSSSTSFILAWDKKVKKYEDVKKYIEKEEHAKIVFNDLLLEQPIILKESNFDFDMNSVLKNITNKLQKIIQSGIFEGWQDTWSPVFTYQAIHDCSYNRAVDACSDDIEKIERNNEKLAKEIAEKFIQGNKGRVIYILEYSDEGGNLFSEMEHGNIFRKLPCIEVSHH